MKIKSQKILWDEKTNQCSLATQYSDESIKVEPITSEDAARWEAEHKY